MTRTTQTPVRSRTRVIWASVAILLLGGIVAVWVWFAVPPRVAIGRRFMRAMVTGQGIDGIHWVDANARSVNSDRVQSLYDSLAKSTFTGSHLVSESYRTTGPDLTEGEARVVFPDGRACRLIVRVRDAPAGPVVGEQNVAVLAWLAARRIDMKQADSSRVITAIADGFDRDSPMLRKLGWQEAKGPHNDTASLDDIAREWRLLAMS